MNAGLRIARASDAAEIADIHVSSWRVTYRGMLPDRYLDHMDRRRLAERWRRRASSPGRERIVVATRDGRVTGFTSFGPAAAEPEFAGEVTMLYVRPELEGLGIGGALLEGALGDLAGSPRYWALIWVLEANDRAIAFYRAHGFRPDGARRLDHFAGAAVPVIRCGRPLNPAIDYGAL